MLNKLTWRFGHVGISGTWDAPLPPGFNQLFREMCQIYYYSATMSKIGWLHKISEQMSSLLEKFFKSNKIDITSFEIENFVPIKSGPLPLDKDKTTIMFTGGKSSLHALLTLLEKTKPKNIQCIYIPNISKSESIYERKSVEEICTRLETRFKIVECSNSVRLNRANHNIGLRDQLLVVLALPYIVDFGSSNIIFGLHDAFITRSGPLFTSHGSAFLLLSERIAQNGMSLKIGPHPISDITRPEIIKDLVKKWPEYFWMTNSCSRQPSSRVDQNSKLKERHPDFKIYNGCGTCIKCLRTNGVLALLEGSGHRVARWNMAKEVSNIYLKKFQNDLELKNIVKELHTNILKGKHSDISSDANFANIDS